MLGVAGRITEEYVRRRFSVVLVGDRIYSDQDEHISIASIAVHGSTAVSALHGACALVVQSVEMTAHCADAATAARALSNGVSSVDDTNRLLVNIPVALEVLVPFSNNDTIALSTTVCDALVAQLRMALHELRCALINMIDASVSRRCIEAAVRALRLDARIFVVDTAIQYVDESMSVIPLPNQNSEVSPRSLVFVVYAIDAADSSTLRRCTSHECCQARKLHTEVSKRLAARRRKLHSVTGVAQLGSSTYSYFSANSLQLPVASWSSCSALAPLPTRQPSHITAKVCSDAASEQSAAWAFAWRRGAKGPTAAVAAIADAHSYHYGASNVEVLFSADAHQVLIDPHIGVPAPRFDVASPVATIHLVKGSYEYFHYGSGGFNDAGWGCAYRSLQTLISWLARSGAVSWHEPIPTHADIQRELVAAHDKPSNIVGSRAWIGSQEIALFLRERFPAVEVRTLFVPRGSQLPQLAAQMLASHFDSGGGPVMMGGGSLAFTLIGVATADPIRARKSFTAPAETAAMADAATRFLVLDPHYFGADEKEIVQRRVVSMAGGSYRSTGVGWRSANSFAPTDNFVNLVFIRCTEA